MLEGWKRKTSSVLIFILVGALVFVFAISGVFSPKFDKGGGQIGSVNGEPIFARDFSKALNRQIENFKRFSGGKFDEAQLKQFGIYNMVFEELVNRKLLVQEAKSSGVLPPEEQIRSEIQKIDAFKVDGNFNTAQYQAILKANGFTPTQFEKSVEEDLIVQSWNKFFSDQVRVSEGELKKEFFLDRERRKIGYVFITQEALSPKKDKQKEEKDKAEPEKDKKEDNTKLLNELASDVLTKLPKDGVTPSKDREKLIEKLLKPYDLKVQTSPWVTRTTNYLASVGAVPELLDDLFASDVNTKFPTSYIKAGGRLVVWLKESETPDMETFKKERDSLTERVRQQKVSGFFKDWLQTVRKKSKIKKDLSAFESS